MKLISADDFDALLVDAQRRAKNNFQYGFLSSVRANLADMPESEAYTEAKKRIENMEKIIEDQEERIAIMSEGCWHDAEKDSPKETDCYIVRIDYGVGQMTTMREYVSSEGKWLMSREEKITHWMPLPKPPKEGDQQ